MAVTGIMPIRTLMGRSYYSIGVSSPTAIKSTRRHNTPRPQRTQYSQSLRRKRKTPDPIEGSLCRIWRSCWRLIRVASLFTFKTSSTARRSWRAILKRRAKNEKKKMKTKRKRKRKAKRKTGELAIWRGWLIQRMRECENMRKCWRVKCWRMGKWWGRCWRVSNRTRANRLWRCTALLCSSQNHEASLSRYQRSWISPERNGKCEWKR